jgi:hypothetical protein
LVPPPGSGDVLARDYLSDRLVTDEYLGHVCQSTAVVVSAVTQALITLIEQPHLRAKMGSAGRDRAAREFDWSIVISRYEALWDELETVRHAANEVAPPTADAVGYPLGDDPFRNLAHYGTRSLCPDLILALGEMGNVEGINRLHTDFMAAYGYARRLSEHEYLGIVNHLGALGPTALANFLAIYPGREAEVYRTIAWLLKFDVVRVVGT